MPPGDRATLQAMVQGERQRPPRGAPTGEVYDFIVVGSGFGGSVSALRLAEKGYRVLVVEAGKRFRAEDFGKTNWNLRRYLWLPALGCHGIQRITLLKDVLVLSGAGVGGGSLVYANTLLAPHDEVFSSGAWPPSARRTRDVRPRRQGRDTERASRNARPRTSVPGTGGDAAPWQGSRGPAGQGGSPVHRLGRRACA